MPRDPRVANVDHFTATTHSRVPPDLRPEDARLPDGFAVCVIGASQGIGEEIAYSFAKAGVAALCIASRTLVDLEVVAENVRQIDASVKVEIAVCDVADSMSVGALAEFVKEKFGRLDVVIPNAAYAGPVTLKMHEGETKWVQRAFDVNATGTCLVAHYFVPLLLESDSGAKGFIAIGSIAGCIRRGIIANTGYTVSKMAQMRLVEMLGEQFGDDGLVAVSVHPGAVNTAMAKGNTPESFVKYLVDDADLCGAVCVWLSGRLREFGWLNGRLISANWDMGELLARKEAIVEKDLLKLALVTE